MNSDKNEIKNRYNDLGSRIYDIRYTEEQLLKYNLVISKIHYGEDELFLDHGCGTGLFMNSLRNPMVGIDQSYMLLRGANKRLLRKENKHLVLGDTDNLPFRSKTFQKAFSFTVIQNISDPYKTLVEVRRVTSGLKVITTLKIAYSLKEITTKIESAGLVIHDIIENENINDWLFFTQ